MDNIILCFVVMCDILDSSIGERVPMTHDDVMSINMESVLFLIYIKLL